MTAAAWQIEPETSLEHDLNEAGLCIEHAPTTFRSALTVDYMAFTSPPRPKRREAKPTRTLSLAPSLTPPVDMPPPPPMDVAEHTPCACGETTAAADDPHARCLACGRKRG